MYIELLVDENSQVYAVDCVVEGSHLRVGALYLSAQINATPIRFPHNEDTFAFDLPEEQLNQPDAARAWDVALPLIDDHV